MIHNEEEHINAAVKEAADKAMAGLKDQEINERVARACGWHHTNPEPELETWPGWAKWRRADGCYFTKCPDYANDLNAIQFAVMDLKRNDAWEYYRYQIELKQICGGLREAVDATARQRAEAFLKVKGEWE